MASHSENRLSSLSLEAMLLLLPLQWDGAASVHASAAAAHRSRALLDRCFALYLVLTKRFLEGHRF